jgi:DNA-binding XRE family transcriptional regulator
MPDSPSSVEVAAAAARLQALVPDAVLVGETGAALHAGHRVSLDDDYVLTDLEERFDERGDLDDWHPLLAAVRRDPDGPVAERVLRLVERHPMYGTSALWRAWIESRRAGDQETHTGAKLRALRVDRGLTQQQLAERLGMTQPEVSRIERRPDAKLSLVRAYVRALGGELSASARFADEIFPLA